MQTIQNMLNINKTKPEEAITHKEHKKVLTEEKKTGESQKATFINI